MTASLLRPAFAFAAAALLAACSQGSGDSMSSMNLMDACDADGNHIVDSGEYTNCFADADRDRDGVISEDEAHEFGGHHGGKR